MTTAATIYILFIAASMSDTDVMHAEFDAIAEEVAGILDEKQNIKWQSVADNIRARFLPR